MLVKVALTLNEIDTFKLEASSIKTVLNGLKMLKGEKYTKNILDNNFKYILIDSSEKNPPIGLVPAVLFGEFIGYDTLLILGETFGEVTVAVIAGAIAAATLSAAVGIVATIVKYALYIAISYVISLLSPTPEFSSDPSQFAARKQSSLFNGAPLIREQGGIVPIVLGNPFAGGVLISSGVSTEDTI